jgi:hypothetical protein
MRTRNWLALLALVAAGGCQSLDEPNLNSPALDDLLNNPTRSKIALTATGLLIGTRAGIAAQNGYVSLLGIVGRESYNFDPADPRFVTEMMVGPLDGGSPAFGGNLWANPYRNILNANVLLVATDRVPAVSTAEKDAVRGFTKTIQAFEYLKVIGTRDANGAPIPVGIDLTAPPAPIATKAQVFAHIVQLLDEAQTHLQAGGSTFPFQLPAGFTGFNTPATFLRFNRALRARVAVYTDDFAGALTALAASFIDTASTTSLDLGLYYDFSTVSGDQTNALFDPEARAILAHPSWETDAQLQAGGAKDDRFVRKIAKLSSAKSAQGLTSDIRFVIYDDVEAPIPIIRNEELILLRAEANIGLNTVASLAAAVTDLNTIRVRSGKLPLYAGATTQIALLDELLYNKRYSLMFEGGHRWIDLRHYGRLSTLPQDPTSGGSAKRFSKFPFPAFECDPRSPTPAGCGTEVGS